MNDQSIRLDAGSLSQVCAEEMSRTMQAYVVAAGGSASLQVIPVPEAQPGEALIKVIRAGICNTDFEILKVRAFSPSP
jgi:threonine dehydrogenase-like Zn-dependent dehydrogenase